MSNDEQAAVSQTYAMLDALGIEVPSVFKPGSSKATGERKIEIQRSLELLRNPGNRILRRPRDADTGTDLGNTQVKAVITEEKAAENEENYHSEASSDSTSFGLTSLLGSFDDSGEEWEGDGRSKCQARVSASPEMSRPSQQRQLLRENLPAEPSKSAPQVE
eukprot:TRINITY_DN1848_c0_g5_i1.p1 TRINITY_DN1848_c0_g5~~TRINITY_DN1848_c0_g5_i1.p1  ORF type:complete len:162 (-),score=31.23 TRINITY_DN1848_c0_g5_i1:132-617(-)